ncbi:MAG: xanthine dehydrogenase family protein molybdopterin-binding subunit [Desulfobacterales bacterium]|nr:xanthine dehydrogenase family protein molybdopterin-binding subunit [Desulfobacterales bacterium]
MATTSSESGKWVGKPMKRKEDERLVIGKGNYTADVSLPGMLHVALLRSPYAHANIVSIDTREAEALPGVVAVVSGQELARQTEPFVVVFPSKMVDYPMAVTKARYVGEPVVAVAAVDRYVAEDALELIRVEYEPLPAVVDVEKACDADAPVIHEEHGSNLGWQDVFTYGDPGKAFEQADVVVSERFHFHRFSSTPIETFAAAAQYDEGSKVLTVWSNLQTPMFRHSGLANALRIPSHQLRLIMPDIGGGFGIKCAVSQYLLITGFLAMRTRRPVTYLEDAQEHLSGGAHGTERISYVQFAASKEGKILGMRFRSLDDEGAFIRPPEPTGVILWCHATTGVYEVENVEINCAAVITNKCPVAPNRGYGRMQHQFTIERMMDMVADKLGMDRTEIRRLNHIPVEKMPWTGPSGVLYDSGDYRAALDKLKNLVDYQGWRQRQAAARKEGRLIGLGIVNLIDPGASNLGEMTLFNPMFRASAAAEAASMRMDTSGNVTVALGSVPQGQGHETVTAQMVADELGITPDNVFVRPGFDNTTHPYAGGSGTYGSRFCAVGSGAVVGAARKIRGKIQRLASRLLEAKPEDIELANGRVFVKGVPQKGMPIAQIAAISYFNPVMMSGEDEGGLEATCTYNYPKANMMDEKKRVNGASTYSNAAHCAVVEVNEHTGQIKVLDYVSVHDSGTLVNPAIVDGQLHGGIVHSLGAALYEEFVYDENGQLLTGSYMDYLLPRATEIPPIKVSHMCSPSPFTALGAKGMGEGGGPVPALLASAVEDALKPLAIRITSSHLAPEKILSLIEAARERAAA